MSAVIRCYSRKSQWVISELRWRFHPVIYFLAFGRRVDNPCFSSLHWWNIWRVNRCRQAALSLNWGMSVLWCASMGLFHPICPWRRQTFCGNQELSVLMFPTKCLIRPRTLSPIVAPGRCLFYKVISLCRAILTVFVLAAISLFCFGRSVVTQCYFRTSVTLACPSWATRILEYTKLPESWYFSHRRDPFCLFR